MRKRQVLQFWDELQGSTAAAVVRKYKDQTGYASARTLNRYVQAERGFREGLPIDELSAKIGWGLAYLKKLRTWWEESSNTANQVESDVGKFQRALLLQGSHHAKELQQDAVSLGRELDQPLEHLLGLFALPANPSLNLELGDGLGALRDSHLWAALKSHNPSSKVWGLTEQWTQELRDIKTQWAPLCRWVESQHQVDQLQNLEPRESVWGTPGFTPSFAKTIILASLRDAYRERSEEYLERLSETEYEIQGPHPLYALSWISYESHVVAVNIDKESLRSSKQLHRDLRSGLGKTDLLGELLSGCREWRRLTIEITEEITRLAQLPFSGYCDLYRTWP